MDITANAVTPEALTEYMMGHTGFAEVSADEWCFAIAQMTNSPCPAPESFGFPWVDGERSPARTDAKTFLDKLRGYQSLTADPGIVGANPPTIESGEPKKLGVLGWTNCSICQQLRQQPWMLVILALGVYFLFFRKR